MWLWQDGDSLMNILEPYLYTGVNLTTFRFRYEGTAAEDLTPTADHVRYDNSFATIYDSLLTLYHGVRLQSRGGGGGCQWAGNNLLSTLARVIQSFIALLLSCVFMHFIPKLTETRQGSHRTVRNA